MSRPEVIAFRRDPELMALAQQIIAPHIEAWAGQYSRQLGQVVTTPVNTTGPAFALIPPGDVLWRVLDASEYLRGINPFNRFRRADDGRFFLLVHDVYELKRYPVPTYFRFAPEANARPEGYVSPFGHFSPYSNN
jgi:hypothetical protein